MIRVTSALLISAAALLAATSAEARTCSSSYYTGKDKEPLWWEGRNNARADWSDRVKGHLGKRWSYWSKAKNANDTCTWLPTQGVNFCVAKAKPCRS